MDAKYCTIAAALLFFVCMASASSYADDALYNRIERLEQRIDQLEQRLDSMDKVEVLVLPPSSSGDESVTDRILREEMGSVEGAILWQGKPLVQTDVKIELTRYTGFSLGSLKKVFMRIKKKSSGQEMALLTRTDSEGRYFFEAVPPGEYMLYWRPDTETGWVHRMRDRSDFEVVAGELTVQNIPEK